MEIKLLSADEMDRIFGEGLKIHGLTDRCGVSSLTVLKDVFVMMKRKLMQLGFKRRRRRELRARYQTRYQECPGIGAEREGRIARHLTISVRWFPPPDDHNER